MSNDLEFAFKKRYNRDVEIKRVTNGKDKTTLDIGGFIITEYRKEGLTDYVTVTNKDKSHKFRTYLEAEVYIADCLGGE